ELIMYTGKYFENIFDKEKIGRIIKFAEKIWEFPYVKAIQTGLEESDANVSLSELKSGIGPNCFPFAITEENNIRKNHLRTEKISGFHSGYIFYNDGNIHEVFENHKKFQ
ncbi:MAG: hypothetical protein K2O60_07725, partial [Ruminococcus sp.]|nr:hypothetical protein [Ruminococcus sp.]